MCVKVYFVYEIVYQFNIEQSGAKGSLFKDRVTDYWENIGHENNLLPKF